MADLHFEKGSARAARGASAPPALVIVSEKTGSAPLATTGSTTRRLKTGATTGRVQGGPAKATTSSVKSGRTGPLGQSAVVKPNVRKTEPQGGKKLLKWIGLGSVLSAIVLFAIFTSIGKENAKKRQDRIIALSSAEVPTGDVSDVALAVAFLEDPKASLSIKGDARKVLERLEGNGISESIHEHLKNAETLNAKLRLSQALAERNYAPAVTDMIEVFKLATTDEQRVQILNSVRSIAGLKDVKTLLDALHGEHSPKVREGFEDTVLAVLRKGGETDPVIEGILTKVSTTSGSERRSLFRILGVLGGDKVGARLRTIYDQKSDAAYQADAIFAYQSWPDRSVIEDVEKIIASTSDAHLRSAAEKAYVRLTTLPGPESPSDLVPLWKKAFEQSKNPNDVRRLFDSIVGFPSHETLALLKEWSGDATHGKLAKGPIVEVEKVIQEVVEIKPGEEIKGNIATVRGDGGASINSFLSSLTGWLSPQTYFSWYFKVTEPGDYVVEIDQATMREEPSDFVVYLAGATLKGQSKTTPNLEEFVPVRPEGTVSLQPGQIYILTVAAGRTIQPRMMDIGAVRLIKP